jgi:hypothetical protein
MMWSGKSRRRCTSIAIARAPRWTRSALLDSVACLAQVTVSVSSAHSTANMCLILCKVAKRSETMAFQRTEPECCRHMGLPELEVSLRERSEVMKSLCTAIGTLSHTASLVQHSLKGRLALLGVIGSSQERLSKYEESAAHRESAHMHFQFSEGCMNADKHSAASVRATGEEIRVRTLTGIVGFLTRNRRKFQRARPRNFDNRISLTTSWGHLPTTFNLYLQRDENLCVVRNFVCCLMCFRRPGMRNFMKSSDSEKALSSLRHHGGHGSSYQPPLTCCSQYCGSFDSRATEYPTICRSPPFRYPAFRQYPTIRRYPAIR